MRIRSKALALFALPLSVLPTVALPRLNTAKTEELQASVENAMAGHAGGAVLADVVTGEILASHELDLAAHGLARPGSTVKLFVLMAPLESGRLSATQRLFCRRQLRIDGVKIDCAHPASVVDLDAEEPIAYSCNSYFAEAATRLSAAELVQAFRRSGFDSPSGLVKEEANGRVEVPRNLEMLQLEALGDRGIEVTALELLGAYRKVALRN